jgi:predicted Zn-dependent protease
MDGAAWEFAVVASEEANAFVVPGGKVVVYTGLLRLLGSQDELAAVLAHEVAHVLARHAAERMTQASTLELLRAVAYWAFGIPVPAGLLAPVFFLPNSRRAETEADLIGIQLAARACFDPAAAASVFEKLGAVERAAGGAAMPKLLRTHPLSDARVAAIRRHLPAAERLAEAAGCAAEPAGFLETFGAFAGRAPGASPLLPPGWAAVVGSLAQGGVAVVDAADG